MSGVQAGGYASARVPLGGAITSIQLICKHMDGSRMSIAEMLSDIDFVEVKIGGKAKIPQLPPDLFFMLEKYFYDSLTGGANTNAAGVIGIDLLPTELEFPTWAERYKYAWGTKGLDEITVHLKIKQTASAIGYVEVYSERNPADTGRVLGEHLVWRSMKSIERAAAGEGLIDDLPKASGTSIRFLAIREGTGEIESTTTEYDKTVYRQENQRTDNERKQLFAGRTPQDGWWLEDFTELNATGSDFPTNGIQELFYTPKWSTAPGTFDVYIQTVEGRQALVAA